jgi:hypothetical protein
MSAVLCLVLLLSCAGPYYERAAITPGLSGGGGIGLTAGDRLVGGPTWPEEATMLGRDLSVLGTGFVRYGVSPNASLFGQLTSGYGLWNHATYRSNTPLDLISCLTDFQLGAKFRVGRHGALRTNLGLMDLFDIAYLHDFGEHLSGGGGIGLRGISLGAVCHVLLAPALIQHTSLIATVFPSSWQHPGRWSAGLLLGTGWEVLARPLGPTGPNYDE